MGAVPWGDVVASILLQFDGELGFNFASKRTTIAPRSGHNCAAIGHNRASIVVLMLQRSPYDDRGGDSARNDARSWLDRTAIAAFFHEVSGLSDGDPSDRDPHDHRGTHYSLPSA